MALMFDSESNEYAIYKNGVKEMNVNTSSFPESQSGEQCELAIREELFRIAFLARCHRRVAYIRPDS